MAEHHELYRRARYYDVIFNRDVSREVDFVVALYAGANGRAPESVLDLACGPAYHARACARRGMRAIGLDLRAEMISFARAQAGPEAAQLSWIVGDMRDFRLDAPVDVAFTMFDSLDCLQTSDEIIAHLRAVAANLRPGGLYLIDLTHPRDCSPYNYGHFVYEGERDGCHVRIDWATNNPVADPLTQVARVALRMTVNDNGERYVYEDMANERFLLPQEIIALSRLSGCFEVLAWYGAYDIAQPFDASPASPRMIAVLQKVERSTAYLSPSLEARSAAAKGMGVFARTAVAPGEVLAVWGGDVLTEDALAASDARTRHHSLQIDDSFYLVPNRPPEPADFINHSCAPNAGLRGALTLVALHPIAAGEEICYDYATSDGGAVPGSFACHCGAPGCRGLVTSADWRLPALQQRYAGHFAPHLQRRIEAMMVMSD
jgi:SAM-dependent methyltransferase